MVLPTAVRRSEQRADDLAQRFLGTESGKASPEQAAPEVDENEEELDDLPDAGEDEPEETDPAPREDQNAWEQRYNSLKGKYDAEVPRLAERVRELERKLAKAAEAPAAQAKPAVTPQDIEDYGEDFVDMVRRVARAEAEALVSRVNQTVQPKIEELGARLNRTAQENAAARVRAELSKRVPDWQTINSSDGFKRWLGRADPMSGASRQQLLLSAYHSGDGPRCVAIFEAYKRETGRPATTATATAKTAPKPETPPPAKQDALLRMAAPGRGRAVAAAEAPAKRTWTRAEIEQVYRDYTHGRTDMSSEQFAQLETEIHAAIKEGRVE